MKKRLAKMMMVFAVAAAMMTACGKNGNTEATAPETEAATTQAVIEATTETQTTEEATEAATKAVVTNVAPKVSQNTKEYYESLEQTLATKGRAYSDKAGKIDLQKNLQWIIRTLPEYTVFNESNKGKATAADSEAVKALCDQFMTEYLTTGTSSVSTNKSNQPYYLLFDLVYGQMEYLEWLDEQSVIFGYYALLNDKNNDGVVACVLVATADKTSGNWVVEADYTDYIQNKISVEQNLDYEGKVTMHLFLDPTTMQYCWSYDDSNNPALYACYLDNAAPQATDLWTLEEARTALKLKDSDVTVTEYHH
jgi:hypothetical protein